jgi:hypothetical protein
MALYYDRRGEPIDVNQWASLFTPSYQCVARDYEVEGYTVSTVWLGLDHNWGDGKILIFETMLFGKGERDQECHRYSAEKEALAGHQAIVTALRNVASLTN